ncbi:hypothetical protein DYB26_015478, partial [Aphanomyces astaci]
SLESADSDERSPMHQGRLSQLLSQPAPGFASYVYHTKEVLNIPGCKLFGHPLYSGGHMNSDRFIKLKSSSTMLLPICDGDDREPLAVLQVCGKTQHFRGMGVTVTVENCLSFTQEDEYLLSGLANFCSGLLAKVMTFTEVERTRKSETVLLTLSRGREAVILSELQVMLGSVAFLTTAPMLATISVERGFKAALSEVFMVVVTGGPMYFLFHIGTKWFYFGQTILAGGAKYRATGRGFVTKHSRFDDLFRFYASSHLYAGFEIAAALALYYVYTQTTQYVALTWSLWLVVFSWTCSPFWFNPLAFEWSDVLEDIKIWVQWMRGQGGNANQSWLAWFKDENSYFLKLRPWAKAFVFLKGFLHFITGLALLTSDDAYHSITAATSYTPLLVMVAMVVVNLVLFFLLFAPRHHGGNESGTVRFLKLVFVLGNTAALVAGWSLLPGMVPCSVSFYFFSAAVATWMLLFFGSDNKLAIQLFFLHDCVLGALCLSVIVVLSAVVVPGKVQTWLLYNNALSRGVVIEDILRSNSSANDPDDDLTLTHMKKIILEQQRVIAALTTPGGGGSESGDTADKMATAKDNFSRAHVSDSDLLDLKDASFKLTQMLHGDYHHQNHQNHQQPKDTTVQVPFQRVRRANSTDFHAAKLVPQHQQPLTHPPKH